MTKLSLLAATLIAATAAQAQTVTLPNGDFEAGVANFPDGFDADPDIPGWSDLGTITDSGVEGSGAWWGTYDGHAAFMAVGNGASNLSSYTIQAGDAFTVNFVAKTWDAASEWTVTLFYDNPANVIGSFSTAVTPTWTDYSNALSISATPESVGGLLGVSFVNSATAGFANLDNVSITVSAIPEPSAYAAIIGALALGAVATRRRRSA